MSANNADLIGKTIHFKKSVLVALGLGPAAPSEIMSRGSSLVLNADVLMASRDTTGTSWIEIEYAKGDASERIGHGPWPTDVPTWEVGSADHEWARKQALAAAFSQPLDKRDAAVAEVRRVYGGIGVFDRNTTTYKREPGERNVS